VLAVEGNVTQGTDESAAGGTGNHGFFSGMIEASGFLIQLKAIAGLPPRQFPEKGWINIRPQ
jgi:hypothetical protein